MTINIPPSIFDIYNNAVTLFERTAHLFFPPVLEECPNCYQNTMRAGLQSMSFYKQDGPIPFENGMPCPYCDGKGSIENQLSVEIPVRIYWKKSDFIKAGSPLINIPDNSIQTIADMKYLSDIERADYMVPYYDGIQEYSIMKFYKLSPSFPQGFKQNPKKYVVTLWGRNES